MELETTTIGGGCFWCIEAIMEELNGVKEVVSGFAGGTTENPTYREVCNGSTGHAEVVQVQFNPKVISFADLLRVFFMMHNPASRNFIGVDKYSQYRSIILYHNKEQQQTAAQVIQELQPYFEQPIVTEVAPLINFYRAEERHQSYYSSNPEKAYCQSVIEPKLRKMREHFSGSISTIRCVTS